MDLRLTRWSFCLDSTITIWSYGDWAAMSNKATTVKGRGIGSDRATELEGLDKGKIELIASDTLPYKQTIGRNLSLSLMEITILVFGFCQENLGCIFFSTFHSNSL